MTRPKTIGMEKRQLGTELRALRTAAGKTQDQAGVRIGKAANKISRVESGKVGISGLELKELLDFYGASEKDRYWCHTLATGSRRRPKKTETTLYLGPKWFRAFRDLEAGASQVMHVAPHVIAGLLQTEDYIRGMFAGRGSAPDGAELDDVLSVRRERRELLTRELASQFVFVLGEAALHRVIGGPEVMAGQLGHVAEVALLPNVDVQVIPFATASYEPLSYEFLVFRFDGDAGTDIVHIPLYDDALYLDRDEESVRRHVELQRRLQAIALGPVESRTFVLELADRFAAERDPRS